MPLPTPKEGEAQQAFISRCMGSDAMQREFPDQKERSAVCYKQFRGKTANALKAISRTEDELRVANYIVLFGGRDLEGLASSKINADGTHGEYFTPDTEFESAYTKAGMVYVDWEHGLGKAEDGPDAPGPDDLFGVVDWSTAKADTMGLWVERALDRRKRYVQMVERLIDAGLVGTSSFPVQDEVKHAPDGRIVRWPLKRDALTVTPMEPRMMREFGDNVLQAFKALGIDPALDDTETEPEPQTETAPEADPSAVAVVKAKVRLERLLQNITED